MKFPTTIFQRKKYNSAQNGTITYQRLFNSWCLKVGTSYQSGPYVRKMWKKSLDQLPSNIYPQKALILGLAGGDFIPLLRKKFPKIEITAIEWDQVMLEINQEQNLYPVDNNIKIINADAKEFLATANEKYDLILVDLYKGNQANNLLYSDESINNIKKVTDYKGYILVNAYNEKNLLNIYLKHFTPVKQWKYKINKLALFQPILSSDYIFHKQSIDYLQTEGLGSKTKLITTPQGIGNSWQIGPITYESYYTEKQPDIVKENKIKFLMWTPINLSAKPKGWHFGYGLHSFKKTGIAYLHNDYWQDWTRHAQRHRKKWLKQDQYQIVETNLEKFIKAFKQSNKLLTIRADLIKILKNKNRISPDNLHLYTVSKKNDHEILAGLAVFDIKDINQSLHVIAFYKNKVKKSEVNYGLIDHWFKTSLAKNITYLNFGNFYEKGCPKAWKGFSYFKSQFGIRFIALPHIFIKIIK